MESGAPNTDESLVASLRVDGAEDRVALPGHHKRLTPDIRLQVNDPDAVTSWRRAWNHLESDHRQVWWQLVAALVVLGYVASLLFVTRPPSGYLSFWDGWVGNIAGVVPLVPIVLRIRRSPRLRGAWTALAIGVAL